MVKQDIDNKPKMMVVEKVTRSLMNKDTGVKESMFLFTDDNIAVKAIGNETNNIFLIILLLRSYL